MGITKLFQRATAINFFGYCSVPIIAKNDTFYENTIEWSEKVVKEISGLSGQVRSIQPLMLLEISTVDCNSGPKASNSCSVHFDDSALLLL